MRQSNNGSLQVGQGPQNLSDRQGWASAWPASKNDTNVNRYLQHRSSIWNLGPGLLRDFSLLHGQFCLQSHPDGAAFKSMVLTFIGTLDKSKSSGSVGLFSTKSIKSNFVFSLEEGMRGKLLVFMFVFLQILSLSPGIRCHGLGPGILMVKYAIVVGSREGELYRLSWEKYTHSSILL